MLPPRWVWKVKYSSGALFDLSSALDGEVHLWTNEDRKSWIVLMQSDGRPVVGRFATDGEVVRPGVLIPFPSFLVSILSCSKSPCGSIQFPPSKPSLDDSPRSCSWKVKFCMHDNSVGVSFSFGFLFKHSSPDRLVLHNKDNIIIDARPMAPDELVDHGSKVDFDNFRVFVGSQFISLEEPIKSPVLAPALNFNRGIEFSNSILKTLGLPVNFSEGPGRREFLLVVDFGRAKFKLDIHTVSLALQACFGGLATKFKVKFLKERCFRFSVASLAVGFQIYNSGKIVEPDFECSFFLWGKGGPNWKFEEKKYYQELEAEWTSVNRPRRSVVDRLQFASSNQAAPPVSSVFNRLKFPAISQGIHEVAGSSVFQNSGSSGRPSYAEKAAAIQLGPAVAPRKGGGPRSTRPALPGLLSVMRFPSFPAPDVSCWADSQIDSWFKALGAALPVITSKCFKDFQHFLSKPGDSSASGTENPSPSSPENPAPLLTSPSSSSPVAMANIPIDPAPFVPRGFQILHVEGRAGVHRVILPRRLRRHEDMAIATIEPMPEGQVHFANIHAVMQEFLVSQHVLFKSIQKCPFGEAYIQFQHVRDRDRLVLESPHEFDDVHISFTKHNEGRNWRRAHLNRDCWLLLVGPPLDYINSEDVRSMFCRIGNVIAWEQDPRDKGKLLVKLRCTELEDIPKSIRLTEGEFPESESWTFSVEVLQQSLLGGGPQDEDPLPDDGVDPHPMPNNVVPVAPPNPPQLEQAGDDDWEDAH